MKAKTGNRALPAIGIIEWFTPNDRESVERLLADMRTLDIRELRTGISWRDLAGAERLAAEEWYGWLFDRLAREVNILPCLSCTPEGLGIAPGTAAPPRDPRTYAALVERIIASYGQYFDWIELWNEPNNLYDWDSRLDPDWRVFSDMVAAAARTARKFGKRTVLAGMCPMDLSWIKLMFQRKVTESIDAVGIHGFPGTWEFDWEDWTQRVAEVRRLLKENGSQAEVWITKTGFSTWRYDEHRQLRAFVKAIEADVDRVYWHAMRDLDPELPAQDGLHVDERHYHLGMKRADGTPKLLYRLWNDGGLPLVRRAVHLNSPTVRAANGERPVLITGGCGFIGTNLAERLLESGRSVLLYDNLSRPGVERNLRTLRDAHRTHLHVETGDVRDRYRLRRAAERAEQVFHFAAQVAVTTSLTDPSEDLAINAGGTLNLLEALRSLRNPPPLVFTSTNKVYGSLDDLKLRIRGKRYEPENQDLAARGISERQPLDLHSPYGCSKGVADQYVLDYARTFSLPAVVFRMSCIYGPHQHGNEDQGWVAHFLMRALEGEPITIYGDGMQVRDILYVRDLVNALLLAQSRMDTIAGRAFNIGGGPGNALSLLELIDFIGELDGRKPRILLRPTRIADQRYYVTDSARFQSETGWFPAVAAQRGVELLYHWLLDRKAALFRRRRLARSDDEVCAYQSPVVVSG
jgi:CDP-paratose 2-epimerase